MNRSLSRTLFGLLAVIVIIAGAGSAEAAKPSVAGVSIDASQVRFQPVVGKANFLLTVSGPDGYQLRKLYEPGEMIALSVAGLSDGAYSYELKALPVLDEYQKEVLFAARESGDLSEVEKLKSSGGLPGEVLVQSATFTVAGGGFADISKAEVATKDIVHLDDVIIDGSLCVGVDCVNGESFGFDTIRLKENNLRIKFQDTSNSASFPSNDWQITANDSANGGLNKFSIDDVDGGRTPFTIEAAARTNALYVENDGDVGFGTNNPVVNLHVVDGNTPTLRLEQDGSSGFTPQTWDLAGNETNFFIRDVTNGSLLPFRIFPSAPSNSIFVASDGDVGFGTTSPDASLDIEASDGTASIKVTESNGTATTRVLMDLNNNGGVRFDLEDTANSVTWVVQNQAQLFEITKAGTGVRELALDGSGNLTILGTLTASGGSTFPDYVFEPDYELMPLSELASFIEENKHLPKIPSASEIAAGGLNMTEMQISLVEKVEELTLYMLAQEEKNQAQEREIKQLKAQLASLTANQ
jgi:hypothetical protein